MRNDLTKSGDTSILVLGPLDISKLAMDCEDFRVDSEDIYNNVIACELLCQSKPFQCLKNLNRESTDLDKVSQLHMFC